jgi:hypothetical protein
MLDYSNRPQYAINLKSGLIFYFLPNKYILLLQSLPEFSSSTCPKAKFVKSFYLFYLFTGPGIRASGLA